MMKGERERERERERTLLMKSKFKKVRFLFSLLTASILGTGLALELDAPLTPINFQLEPIFNIFLRKTISKAS